MLTQTLVTKDSISFYHRAPLSTFPRPNHFMSVSDYQEAPMRKVLHRIRFISPSVYRKATLREESRSIHFMSVIISRHYWATYVYYNSLNSCQ